MRAFGNVFFLVNALFLSHWTPLGWGYSNTDTEASSAALINSEGDVSVGTASPLPQAAQRPRTKRRAGPQQRVHSALTGPGPDPLEDERQQHEGETGEQLQQEQQLQQVQQHHQQHEEEKPQQHEQTSIFESFQIFYPQKGIDLIQLVKGLPVTPTSFSEVLGTGGRGENSSGTCFSERGHVLTGPTSQTFRGQYRITGSSLGLFDGNFFVAADAACNNPRADYDPVNVTRIPNQTDLVDHSSLAIHLPADSYETKTLFICGPTVGSEAPTCLAKVEAKSKFRLILLTQAFLKDDIGMMVLALGIFVCCLGFLLASLHAILLWLWMPKPRAKVTKLKGLGGSGVWMLFVNTIVKGLMFVFGVDHMASMIVRSSLAQAHRYLINAIVTSGVILGVLGVIRISNLLYSSQLYEIALRQGKTVVTRSTTFTFKFSGQNVAFSVLDICVAGSIVLFSGLCLYALVVSIDDDTKGEELFLNVCECWRAYPALVQAVANNIMRHTLQRNGLVQAHLQSLVISEKKEADPEGGAHLVDHLRMHPKVEIGMGRFCEACRNNRDPLDDIDIHCKDPDSLEEGAELGLNDIHWHPKYVYKKTGAGVTMCSLPVCLGLMLIVFIQASLERRKYVGEVPTLKFVVPSKGHLYPDFDPHVMDYNLYYPEYASSLTLLNEGDPILAEKKEFHMSGETTNISWVDVDEPLHPVSVRSARDTQYSPTLDATVRGGEAFNGKASELTNYSFSMSRVEIVLMTANISDDRNWSTVLRTLPQTRYDVSVPAGTPKVWIEMTGSFHIQSIPISEQAWTDSWDDSNRSCDSHWTNKTIPVFKQMANSSDHACKRECRNEAIRNVTTDCTQYCQFGYSVPNGCYFVMVRTRSAAALHEYNRKKDKELLDYDNKPVTDLLGQVETSVAICKNILFACDNKSSDIQKTVLFEGRVAKNFSLDLPTEGMGQFTFTFQSKGKHQLHPAAIFTKHVQLWKGAPTLDALMVVPEAGLNVVEDRRADGDWNVLLKKFQVNEKPGPLKLLVFGRAPGYDFKINASTISDTKWNASDNRFNVSGRCAKLSESERLAWPVCAEGDAYKEYQEENQTFARIVEIDALFPDSRKTGTVRAVKESRGLDSTNFTLHFMKEDYPAKWAFENADGGHCKLAAPTRTAEEIFQMQEVSVMETAADRCTVSIELISRDGSVNFTRSELFLWLLRNSWDVKWRIKLLNAMARKNTRMVSEVVRFGARGILPVNNETVLPPAFKRSWDASFLLPWDQVLANTENPDELMCWFAHDPAGHRIVRSEEVLPSPRSVVAALDGVVTDTRREAIIRLLQGDCLRFSTPPQNSADTEEGPDKELQSDRRQARDWAHEATSPIAVAIAKSEDAILNVLLEEYGENYTDVSVLDERVDDVVTLGYIELSILARCDKCVEPLLNFVRNFSARCEGQEGQSQNQTRKHFEKEHRRLQLGIRAFNISEKEHLEERVKIMEKYLLEVEFREVDFDGAVLTNEGLRHVSGILFSLDKLVFLSLQNTQLNLCKDDRDQDELLLFLTNFSQLTWFAMSDNRLCGKGLSQIARFLNSTSLESVWLRDVGITSGDSAALTELGETLQSSSSLASLNMSRNALGAKGLLALLKGTSSLKHLNASDVNLTFNNETQDQFKALVDALKSLKNLSSLDLSNNDLGEKGLEALLPAFERWPNLESLNLANTKLTRWSVYSLVGNLTNITLKELRLGRNENFIYGPPQLKELYKLKHLEVLDLHSALRRSRSPARSKLLVRDLDLGLSRYWKHMRVLDMSHNGIDWGHITEFWESDGNRERRSKNVRPREVHLGWNGLKRTKGSARRHHRRTQRRRGCTSGCKIPEIGDTLNRSIEVLDLSGYPVTSSRLARRFSRYALSSKEVEIRELRWDGRLLGNGSFAFLSTLPLLTKLCLRWNNFSSPVLQDLLQTAGELRYLKELDISGSTLTPTDWPRNGYDLFPNLRLLRGSFDTLALQYLRHWLPTTQVRTSLSKKEQRKITSPTETQVATSPPPTQAKTSSARAKRKRGGSTTPVKTSSAKPG